MKQLEHNIYYSGVYPMTIESRRAVINGNVMYLTDDHQLHRVDGPAVEYANGERYWYLNGERHREDGPAVEFQDGYIGWYWHGQQLTFEQWADAMGLSMTERTQMRIIWGC
jgi:hypothetical protein